MHNLDFTVLYYTSNWINEEAAKRIRMDLVRKAGDLRIVSVSQKPIELGDNICVGEVGPSLYNLFNQVLIGAKEVNTKFILCAEDDFLYSKDRFEFVPPRDDTFYYDTNRWGLNKDGRFWLRERTSFGTCIAPTKELIATLEARYSKHTSPDSSAIKYFGEPGKYEKSLQIPKVNMKHIHFDMPTVTFNHRDSLGRKRMVLNTDVIKYELPVWGNGKELWMEYMG